MNHCRVKQSEQRFLQIYPDNLVIHVVTRTASSSTMELISQIGGTMGIFLGCSVLSLVEMAAEIMKRINREI